MSTQLLEDFSNQDILDTGETLEMYENMHHSLDNYFTPITQEYATNNDYLYDDNGTDTLSSQQLTDFLEVDEDYAPLEINEQHASDKDEDSYSSVTSNTLEFVTKYLQFSNIPIIHDKQKRDAQIMTWLEEYHSFTDEELQDAVVKERKNYLRDCVILNTFFLLPYVLSKKQLPINIFEDVIQTTIINLLRAIENYNPKSKAKFSSYITGYIKDGIKITLHKEQYVYIPLHKRFQKKVKLKDGSVSVKPAEQLPEVVRLNETTCDVSTELLFNNDTPLYNNYDKHLQDEVFVAFPYVTLKDKMFCINNFPNIRDNVSTSHEDKILATLQMLLHKKHPLLSEEEKFCVIHYYGIFGTDNVTYSKLTEMFEQQFNTEVTKNIVTRITKVGFNKIKKYFKNLKISFNLSSAT